MDFIAAHQFTIIGLIFMLVLGPAVGNYACSVVYRLPLGKTPFERHPFCGHCNADLKPKDLFPIISWFSTGGKCRYCQGVIPRIYTIIEIACLMIFMAYFLAFGLGEHFLLYTAFAVFAVILGATEWQQGWLSSSIYTYAISFAAIARTLEEGTIFGWIKGFVVMLVLAIAVAKLESALRKQPFKSFEANWVWWLALIAIAVPIHITYMPLLVLLAAPFGLSNTRLDVPIFTTLALLLPIFLAF